MATYKLLCVIVYINLLSMCYSIRWETLWSGLPQQKEVEKEYRIFSPPLKQIDYSTKLVIEIVIVVLELA